MIEHRGFCPYCQVEVVKVLKRFRFSFHCGKGHTVYKGMTRDMYRDRGWLI